MARKIIDKACFIVLIVLFGRISLETSYAKELPRVIEAYKADQFVEIFVEGEFEKEKLRCEVSGKEAKIVGRGNVNEGKVEAKTILLIEDSSRTSKKEREQILSFAEALVKEKKEYEEFKIYKFSKQIEVLQGFTKERYDLSKSLEKLNFEGKESRVYDAVIETFPELVKGEVPTFYRTILLTAGGDSDVSEMIAEEVIDKISEAGYFIDVVTVGKEAKKNKYLSALSRKSEGRYLAVSGKEAVEMQAGELGLQELSWLRIQVPKEYLDGVKRPVTLSDEAKKAEFKVEVSSMEIEEEEEAPKKEEKPVKEAVKIEKEEKREKEEKGFFETYKLYFLIAGGVLGVGLLSGGGFLLLHRKKKKEEENEFKIVNPEGDSSFQRTETREGGVSPVVARRSEGMNIRLRDIENLDQIWRMTVSSEITVGRDIGCPVSIPDKSVSRWQCKLYTKQGSLFLENISHTNGTLLNGVKIEEQHVVRDGDQIKCGNVTLVVDVLSMEKQKDTEEEDKKTVVLNV